MSVNGDSGQRVDVDPCVLERMVGDLRAAMPVERVYVFGSRARLDARPDSDVDVYVVTAEDGLSDLEHMRRARRALGWMVPWETYSKDVLCATAAEFAERAPDLSRVEHQVAEEGKVVYAC